MAVLAAIVTFTLVQTRHAKSAEPTTFTAILSDIVQGIGQGTPQLQAGIIQTIAVRGDGAHIRDYNYLPAKSGPGHRIRQISFPTGVYAMVWESVKSVSTWKPGYHMLSTDPASGCLVAEVGGPLKIKSWANDTFMGLAAVKVELSLPDPKAHSFMWMAPALHCLAIRQTAVFDGASSDEVTLQSYKLGEPDASEFAIPADYEEIAPSIGWSRMRAWRMSFNPDCCGKSGPVDTSHDASYFANRP